jgi:hypothetical protein
LFDFFSLTIHIVSYFGGLLFPGSNSSLISGSMKLMNPLGAETKQRFYLTESLMTFIESLRLLAHTILRYVAVVSLFF